MDSELIDRLHPWLLATLATSGLDPKDMTDFVVSLLSVPGSLEEVRQRIVSELGEFLESNTEGFVNAMFAEIDRLQSGVTGAQQPGQQPGQFGQQAEQQQQQPPQQQPQASREQPLLPQMAGGQEEFRRNFRGDATPFQRSRSAEVLSQNNNDPQFPPFPPPGFPPQGMPPQGFMPPFPPMGFPNGGQPEFGGYNNRYNNRQRNHHNPRQYNPIKSVRNELSVANRRLVVEGIPDEKLSEQSVREYFSRFGNVVSTKIHTDQHMAELEFEAHDQAVAAHKSPDPIFDNRFVKVYWRKKLPEEEEPEPDIEAVRRMQAIKQQQFQEKEAKRKDLTAKLRELMTLQASMLGEKQELLKSNQATPERLQEHQQRYDALTQETAQLKGELSLLNSSGAQPGRGGYRGGARGRGSSPYGRGSSFRGRGSYRGGYARGGSFGGASLDRRPKGVYLDGVTQDKDEILRGRLAAANYSDYQRQGDNGVVIDFADRKSAEDFFNTVSDIPELGPNVQKRYVRTESASEPKSSDTSVSMDMS